MDRKDLAEAAGDQRLRENGTSVFRPGYGVAFGLSSVPRKLE